MQRLFLIISILFCWGCLTPKDTAVSRRMQNLTARYNYIYNANVLLEDYRAKLEETHADDYQNILSVYLDPLPQKDLLLLPDAPDKQLDAIVEKAQAIIAEKTYSNYIDDAYLFLGKASYLKGNYFSSYAYFDYAEKAFIDNKKTNIIALDWKARSQMELGNLDHADKILDTLFTVANGYKKNIAEPLATLAQLRIYQGKFNEAEVLLQEAVKTVKNRDYKIRWRFILAQLQQKTDRTKDALKNFKKVVHSNGSFEMYFHANLSTIAIEAELNAQQINVEKELLKLLKDDKNIDYTDQINAKIAALFMQKREFEKAEYYLLKSVKSSTKNIGQKALSYLAIANLNFDEFKNYRKAKLYYDSTITFLPKSYPDYNSIAKKALNLEYLTERYKKIDLQDTLQAIAKLPESKRKNRIHLFVKKNLDSVVAPSTNLVTMDEPGNSGFLEPDQDVQTQTLGNGNNFYFNNPAAVSRGFIDFRIKWGSRTLQDNWRQSVQSSAQQNNQILAGNDIATAAKVGTDSVSAASAKGTLLEKKYLAALPVTDSLLKASNQEIIDAYYQIANFYQQELKDNNEAEKIYKILLIRFPNNNQLSAILYGLYLINKDTDEQKASGYKEEIITKFKDSEYAKILVDPLYSNKQAEIVKAANSNYEQIYERFLSKNYAGTINSVDNYLSENLSSGIDPQFAYLKALAIGRTSKVPALIAAFKNILQNYPDDKIAVPLVTSQLNYINNHLEDFEQRPVALVEFGERSELDNLVAKNPQEPNSTKPKAIVKTPAVVDKNSPVAVVKPLPVVKNDTLITPSFKKASIFSLDVSKEYYYVIDVRDATLTLSSSRFGLGQFNRGNYPDNNLVHKLLELDDDQLIYINSFVDLQDAEYYRSSIKDQLSKIMKVSADKYQSFIISKENFEKLTDRKRIDSYLEFYKENF